MMKTTLPVLFLFVICIFAASDTRAATLTVTKTADTNDGVCDADCSLREAVAAAASGDTVVFSSLFNTPQTITLTLGQITIDKDLTITGTGQNLVTISGNMAGRIFNISNNSSDADVTMSEMKLRDGKTDPESGGAISIVGGSLTLTGMEFTNNMSRQPPNPSSGAAIFGLGSTVTLANLYVHHNPYPDAIDVGGTLNISDSVLDNNFSGLGATTLNMNNTTVSESMRLGIGGTFLKITNSRVINGGYRGIQQVSSNGTMVIDNSIVSGNMESGIVNVGRAPNGGFAKINNSTISGNSSLDSGGGILNGGTLYVSNSSITGNTAPVGGGVFTYGSGQVFLTNATVSGNFALGTASSSFGGGIYNETADGGPGSLLTLINSTIANNFCSGKGGGIRHNNSGSIRIKNTIIAQNTSGSSSEVDVSGAIISNGVNLIGNTTGSSGWIAADLLNINPMLASLADNGGSTLTHALLPGSPAINAGNNSVAIDPQTQMALTSDQRGFLRFYGGTVDIGSYEVQPEITGTITYGNATGSPTPRFVSGVLLSALGSPSLTATSRADGTYTLGGFGSGAYTVTPSKTSGANGISSFDSGLIAKHVSGLQVLTGDQLIVADVSGNGTLSSFDAGQIARYTVGINGFGSSGNWVFVPASRTYSSVNSTQANEDFIALLMGDVSGNWVNQ